VKQKYDQLMIKAGPNKCLVENDWKLKKINEYLKLQAVLWGLKHFVMS